MVVQSWAVCSHQIEHMLLGSPIFRQDLEDREPCDLLGGATLGVRFAVVAFPIEPKIRDRRPSGSDFPLAGALREAGPGRVTY